MWKTDTLWFDAAVVLDIFAVGNILFGHFEAHRLVLAVILTLSATLGREWAFGVLMLGLLGAAYIHLRWLPKHGVNGWTGEPRDRYLELVTKRSAKPKSGA